MERTETEFILANIKEYLRNNLKIDVQVTSDPRYGSAETKTVKCEVALTLEGETLYSDYDWVELDFSEFVVDRKY